LFRKIDALANIRRMFDDNLLSRMYFTEKRSQKMVSIFHDNLDFLPEALTNITEIVQLKSWPVIDEISDSDLFLINIANSQAFECCANIRLRKINRYNPVVFSYNKDTKIKAKQSLDMNVGCTDIIDMSADPIMISCKLNSLMKYKKMYVSFSGKLKKSMYLSAIDSTTGVYNRSFFEEYIKSHGKYFNNSAILIIDIDKFKLVNDQHGHAFADSMLKYVSSTIKRYIRSSDIIARYGGDEFIIYMDNILKKTASDIANRIQKTVENSPFKGACCTVSIGVCCIDENGTFSINDAISVADKFMYIAKQNGGNAVKVCA
jgi:diguanylate cyclase (GGDEF)-like protein